MKKNNYFKLDLIRLISCIIIFLYHIGLLKGGYLAVCIFFVLTGYLRITSTLNKDFNIKEYYIKRIKRIYIPVIIVLFITISIMSFLNINYLNLKPESTSIILGYNNYWQLNANLDYFVRHINSPFIHLWYISILIQFELLFPLIYLGIKKIKDKINKNIPIIILLILIICSFILFTIQVLNNNLMSAYYGTLSRSFSYLIGILLGYIHFNYKPIVNKRTNLFYYFYLSIIVLLCIFIDVNSKLFIISMLLTSLVSARLISYSITSINNENIIITTLSKYTYEIYLIQYPVIYFIQNISINIIVKLLIVLSITILLSIYLNKSLNLNKKNNYLLIPIILLTIFGIYKYVTAKDYTEEMNKLKNNLTKNQEIMIKKQKEYKENKKNEENEWNSLINDINTEEELKEKVKDLHIVGIGDSIMELALNDLYEVFPNGYFDAVENRRPSQVNDLLINLKNQGILGDIIIFCIGTNGEFYDSYTIPIMETLEGKEVFWLNATNADYDTFNGDLYNLASRYPNIHIIDWVSVVNEHPEYLISDRVHPTIHGCEVYAETIYDAIYNEIKEKQEENNNNITFIGNDLLLGIYNDLENEYQNSNYIINDGKNIEKLLEDLNNNEINSKIVFLFDNNINLTDKDFNNIKKKYYDNEIYILDINNSYKLNKIKVIKYQLKSKDYASDGIHINNKANKKIFAVIKKTLQK